MPVSFKVAQHPANSVNLPQSYGLTPGELLAKACQHQYKSAGKVLGSSFATELRTESTKSSLNRRLSRLNPFAKQSKPKHHNLVVRPDDVWIAILAQFNFYVNAHAANFVAHDGKQQLKIQTQQPREAMDFAALSRQMVGLLATAVVDPTLRAWVMPDFSTTTLKDQTVGAIVMMSTLKAYFEYIFEAIACGIPRVTIDGTKADSPPSEEAKGNPHSITAPESLSAKDFWKAYLKHPSPQKLVLDETPFHMVESLNIPASYVEVPVRLPRPTPSTRGPASWSPASLGRWYRAVRRRAKP
ncbi:hypothetical protein B0H11DRAFT_2402119 [Mycena galericulata]|nr:hypothetical protein B0H11DRAFT_2402119 [Mycena galericulata]